jgi:hypothetical protein
MLTCVAVVTLLTACGDDGSDSPSAGEGATDSTSSVRTDDSPGDDSSGDEVASDAPLPEDQPRLDLEQRHPNGTVLRVTAIAFDRAATTVSVEAINGFVESIDLNSVDLQLVDDQSNIYNFVPPDDNPDLRVESGATLTGDLTFLGRLDRGATSLRLVVNSYDIEPIFVDDEYDQASAPSFDIGDIPVVRD